MLNRDHRLDSPYLPPFDRGGCGIGFVADQYGRPSHALLQRGLEALVNLQHRGALDADARTGDGAGVLTPLPRRLFVRETERLTGRSPDPDRLGVGVFFFQPGTVETGMRLFESALAKHSLCVLAWREAPIHAEVLGERARATQPHIFHAIIEHHSTLYNHKFEHRLYLARKQFEREARAAGLGAYAPSCSSRTIVYKGLFLAPQLRAFYADLQNPDYSVPLVVFHQRYSTNTFPTWARAQPFRVLCHNGEINTLQGNLAWMRAREPGLTAEFCADPAELRPVIDTEGSDSAMLDNATELLVLGGRKIQHAVTMLAPPAWEQLTDLPERIRDFYAYHACLSEPWDGPAALIFTDGRTVGAALDRNGLRPCRYVITADGLVVAASEAGAVALEETRILVRGKLGPGQMVIVDTQQGIVLEDGQVKAELASAKPYGTWVRQNLRTIRNEQLSMGQLSGPAKSLPIDHSSLLIAQAAFGYTHEELTVVLKPMVENSVEAIGSMGDDTPPAILSEQPRPLFSYFRQRFAEVTNPPIDPLREELVMSLRVRLGARGNFLAETSQQARLLELDSPFLTDDALAALKADAELRAVTLSTLFPAADGVAGLERALTRLCAEAEAAVRGGAQTLILSDRGVGEPHTFAPSLLALSAVHNHLLRADLRTCVDFVIESGEPRDVHHFATLIGYSAAAINPYLALQTAVEVSGAKFAPAEAIARYLHAAEHGLLKIMSKMGISTVDAYCGAQIFEVIGLSSAIIEQYFTGTLAHLEGIGLGRIAQIVLRWHAAAFPPQPQTEVKLDSPGFYKFKRSGELHAFSPSIVHALHEAVKTPGALNGGWSEGYAAYKRYSQLQHSRAPVDVRDLLDFNPPAITAAPDNKNLTAENAEDAENSENSARSAVKPNEVESTYTIVRRFSTAAMSHGALSAEAHATMTVAMNRLGAWSNSGEGGEDPARYQNESNDRIKQVASARFGVTPAYLVSSDELQIKMAQGSKPGEGGQLPGHKVTAEIAAIRHATPGVTLISPPPHHDIYSIEDLAQLIFDLRQINPRAAISVKLVAQAGIGAIAAGVAKAGADIILISGSSGGTGASPLSSIKYAGVPWEIGLAEAQYVLVTSGLRGRVRLRADGGMRTGRDVVVAALLGADEYSFGTAAVVAEGCLMARACHMNTCPAGIATQRPELRAKFDGTPEQVMAFMLYIAEEVREVLASLGLTSLDEAIGRVELLKQAAAGRTGDEALNLDRLLLAPPGDGPRRYIGEPNRVSATSPLNEQLIADFGFRISDLNQQSEVINPHFTYRISNSDRTFGARLASEIARQYGDMGLPEGAIDVTLTGSAGQSFGAFGVPGLNLTLIGEANDYVGKGLAGGQIVIYAPAPPDELLGARETAVLAGNTVLYGATGGEVFLAGRAGERFAVRNSGAFAVVEGVGDHGCEYMTGGMVIVLGAIGYNFAAGMTGGIAYVLDEDESAAARINPQLVRVEALPPDEVEQLHDWISRHAQLTHSRKANALLRHWSEVSTHFLKVVPKDQPAQAAPIAVTPATISQPVLR
ncbi:MAG TPA: glutamate synthase large subunit [Anaerolineae bacterium]|nr:glutamate synthase large subunit [Anaerolineae bacterium]